MSGHVKPKKQPENSYVQVLTSDGVRVLREDQALVKSKKQRSVIIDPESTPSTVYGSAVSWKLNDHSIEEVAYVRLRWLVTETGGAAAITTAPSAGFIDTIDYLVNSQNIMHQTGLGTAVFDWMATDSHEFATTLTQRHSGATYGDHAEIAISGTVNMVHELVLCPFKRLNLSALRDNFQVKCTFATQAIAELSGTGVSAVTLPKLEVIYYEQSSAQQIHDVARYNAGVDFNYLNPIHDEQLSTSITSGTRHNVQLKEVSDESALSAMLVVLYRDTTTGFTTTPLASFDAWVDASLLDANGNRVGLSNVDSTSQDLKSYAQKTMRNQ